MGYAPERKGQEARGYLNQGRSNMASEKQQCNADPQLERDIFKNSSHSGL